MIVPDKPSISPTIKRTISMPLGAEPYISQIMSRLKFKEIDRVATGGMMSEPFLLITYSGLDEDYDEDKYYASKTEPNGRKCYYSLRFPEGYHSAEFNLLETHKKMKALDNAQLHSLSEL